MPMLMTLPAIIPIDSRLGLGGGERRASYSSCTPYMLTLRMKLSYYWNVDASIVRKAGCCEP